MCLLGAKAGSKLTTITQVLAHNIFTGIGDGDFANWQIKARAKTMLPQELAEYIEGIAFIQMHMDAAYKRALQLHHRAMCADCTADPIPMQITEGHAAQEPDWRPI